MITLKDIQNRKEILLNYYKNNPNEYIYGGVFHPSDNDLDLYYSYYGAVWLQMDDEIDNFSEICGEEYFSLDSFKRALNYKVADYFASKGYPHKSVLWAIYNCEDSTWSCEKIDKNQIPIFHEDFLFTYKQAKTNKIFENTRKEFSKLIYPTVKSICKNISFKPEQTLTLLEFGFLNLRSIDNEYNSFEDFMDSIDFDESEEEEEEKSLGFKLLKRISTESFNNVKQIDFGLINIQDYADKFERYYNKKIIFKI
ncbi:hypothetical protein [Aureivirga marina]|uniref:hypothetical protein n=1 Tax=Aureivirga marina TaxID=1182451 RepID=UPI0018CBD1A0|nr:hypothetical protein [Aureivirga marina]